jgi:hypothetical protein
VGENLQLLVGDQALELTFSFSSSFNRIASSAFMPPYWARQRWKVTSDTSTRVFLRRREKEGGKARKAPWVQWDPEPRTRSARASCP